LRRTFVRLDLRVLDRGEDQVLDDLFLVRVEDRGVDVQADQLALSGRSRLDQPRAALAGHGDRVEPFLHVGHLALHFLRGLHHLGHVAKPAESFEHLSLLIRFGSYIGMVVLLHNIWPAH
jgi:hypothetical protein